MVKGEVLKGNHAWLSGLDMRRVRKKKKNQREKEVGLRRSIRGLSQKWDVVQRKITSRASQKRKGRI